MTAPHLRFPNFDSNWISCKVEDLYKVISTNSYSRNDLNYNNGQVKNIHYGDIHVKFQSHLNTAQTHLPYINENINYHRYSGDSFCTDGDIILADASEDVKDIGKSVEILNILNEKVVAGLHTIHLKPTSKAMFLGFAGYLFRTKSVVKQIQKESQGAKVLGISGKKILKLDLIYPENNTEQKKVAEFLQKIDNRLNLLKERKKLLVQYKKAVLQKIFSQELRFEDEHGNTYPDWKEKKLIELIDYEQPTKYLVNSTEYRSDYQTPVLTAGKTFILGYTNETDGIFSNGLPVIIFDDFTTASKFVDFPFKAKSSAMKILKVKGDNSTIFIFEAMQNINFEIGGHSRHWISIFSQFPILVPDIREQKKIESFIKNLNSKIKFINDSIEYSEQWKQSLLNQMFL